MKNKLAKIRSKLHPEGGEEVAKGLISSSLDEIAYIFNIRYVLSFPHCFDRSLICCFYDEEYTNLYLSASCSFYIYIYIYTPHFPSPSFTMLTIPYTLLTIIEGVTFRATQSSFPMV